MKCPTCPTQNLVMSERQGIEIDYCPECRGVWLDRGELDKIIERSALQQPAPTKNESFTSSTRHQDERNYYHKHSKQHKRKSFLSELFD